MPALCCLLIVAFCLGGSVTLWRATAMATTMSRHAVVNTPQDTSHDTASTDAASGDACDDAAVTDETSHQDCDCGAMGCACPCGVTSVPVAHAAVFATQHWLAPLRAPSDLGASIRIALPAAFRPPIG
jgi:hypothetical protein